MLLAREFFGIAAVSTQPLASGNDNPEWCVLLAGHLQGRYGFFPDDQCG
jgi:hypothetical protein